MMRKGTVATTLLVGTAVCFIFVGSAYAGDWSNPSGSTPAFGWSDGFNNTDHFGDPTVTADGFLFDNPVDFRADGGGTIGDSVTDFARVTVDIAGSTPSGAPSIDTIIVKEWGTWSESLGTVPATDLEFMSSFSIFRYSPAPLGATGAIDIDINYFGDGTWAAEYVLIAGEAGNPPRADLPWQRFQITVTNTLQVNGGAPADSFFVKEGMQIITPEPASLLLLLAGFGVMTRQRHWHR